MLFTIFAIFAFCWLPYHLYFLYTYHKTEINRYPFTQHLYLGFYWLAMFNSALNPLIYCLLNERQVFKNKSRK
ncbi:tachykinin-like peptides receptor 86C [Dinothrombium tinctorium]|uniref:Tachykinin-like peptides receptor 86C n=1 Tax=Dinothrombium tinctorium TaxID=1965070 RepID=A0A443QGW0_9ACAR|nr:tachykinin-like peptides receptor 86C [Dinothrombium tinctorium]RWS02247.1 tachykinin-like peptides receptor 86C [Dinothrombium tinctorium]RWS02932.1 tachykinin-like peptides receptor 86C [Dinothrombium tinctorium]